VIVKAYILSGIYSGLAGVVMLSRLGSANARYGVSYMLLSVLLSVLGGTDPDGGFGKVSGLSSACLPSSR
jgi:simple sugar transport system permease protein